jgi:hypothetical protein
MAKKYRISQLASGLFKLEVLASDPQDQEENWVPASSTNFNSKEDAERGIERLVAKLQWIYDEDGCQL